MLPNRPLPRSHIGASRGHSENDWNQTRVRLEVTCHWGQSPAALRWSQPPTAFHRSHSPVELRRWFERHLRCEQHQPEATSPRPALARSRLSSNHRPYGAAAARSTASPHLHQSEATPSPNNISGKLPSAANDSCPLEPQKPQTSAEVWGFSLGIVAPTRGRFR